MAVHNFNSSTISWDHDATTGETVTFKLRNWAESQNERTMADITSSTDTRREFMAGLAGEKVWTTELIWEPAVTNSTYADWEAWVTECGTGDLVFDFPNGPCSAVTIKLTCKAWLKGYEITGEIDEAFIVTTTWHIDSVSVGAGP